MTNVFNCACKDQYMTIQRCRDKDFVPQKRIFLVEMLQGTNALNPQFFLLISPNTSFFREGENNEMKW